MEVGLSIGSNLGDRLSNIKLTIEKISHFQETSVIAKSPVYETEPVGVMPEHQDMVFLNSVIIVDTKIQPGELITQLHNLEKDMGRPLSHTPNAPRTIDIDIIYAGNESIDDPSLTLPHPDWAKRRFVVQPLADIRPDLTIHGQDATVKELLLTLPETPKVLPYDSGSYTDPGR